MSNYIGELIAEVQQMCHEGENLPKSIKLDAQQTLNFFDCRKTWRPHVTVRCVPCETPSMDPITLRPEFGITKESYTIEGVNILPAFDYHGIVYFFLRRKGANIIPVRQKAVVEQEE